MTRENGVLDRVRVLMHLRGAICLKTTSGGNPDLVCCQRGRTVVIETKAPGKRPRPLQYQRLKEWAASGAVALWTADVVTFYRIGADGSETAVGAGEKPRDDDMGSNAGFSEGNLRPPPQLRGVTDPAKNNRRGASTKT